MSARIETLQNVERLLVAGQYECAARELIWNLGDWRTPIGAFSPGQVINAIELVSDKEFEADRRKHYGCRQSTAWNQTPRAMVDAALSQPNHQKGTP